MILAAGGYDSSGNVRLFKCRTPSGPHFEANGNGHEQGNGIVNYY